MSDTLTQAPTRASVSRSLVLATIVAASLSLACEPDDLPDAQLLESAHFRYHARADAVLDPTILDRLEAKRADIVAAFGVESGVVDYYLFRDGEDLAASTPCAVPCTSGRSIFSQVPFQEHELVHALLHDAGEPALVLGEGVAQYAACAQPNLAGPVDPGSWPAAIGSFARYDFGQRLTSWMIEVGGPKRFIDFYGEGLATTDPALFALQFQRAWGRRLSDVAVTIDDARYAGSVCPCTAPALATDGALTRFVETQEYRVLDVPLESLVALDNDGDQIVFPAACGAALDAPGLVGPDPSPTSTLARLAPGKYATTTVISRSGVFAPGMTSVSAALTPKTDWSCEGAPTVSVAVKDAALWVAPALSGGTTWFAVEMDGQRTLDALTKNTLVELCTSCQRKDCLGRGFAEDFTAPAPPSGKYLLGLSSSYAGTRTVASVGLRIRAP